MATTIQLDVKLNKAAAEADIQSIDSALKKLSGTPTVIQIQVEGAQAAANTLAKIELEQEKAASKIAVERERRLTKEGEQQARAALQTQKHADRMEELAARTNEASQASNALSVALGNIASRAFHVAVQKVAQATKEAVTEMKDVDTQLTNISKVSGITGKALKEMGDRAYDTASKYGVAADEYLSAVYTFQKAGLGDSAEAMGELAVKTMLVGDTTADVASQFLISANAAWQYGGNMAKLNQLVDEADYINNNYATSLDKLSSGLPRVASVAAQAGMSAEETLAALGTITAVTQESGTKAATALRALILNIEGQVGEFVDETGESFTVTEESVKSMQGLMEKYAKAELDAAKASGELINPMTAIKAIFEGMANSDLNNQELFTLLSGMGGKLRTNQLTALVQNYELFDEMLNKIADSAGTADSEIALMMESWERKGQVLKNTWTELIADIVSTDTFKGGIDLLTGFIDNLDQKIKESKNPFLKRDETESTLQQLKDEYDALIGKSGELNETDQARLKTIEAQIRLLERQAQIETEQAAEKMQGELTGNARDSHTANLLRRGYDNIEFTGDINAYQNALAGLVSTYQDYYDKVKMVEEAGGQLTESQQQFISDFEGISAAASAQGAHIDGLADGYYRLVDAQGNVIAYAKDVSTAYDEQSKAIDESRRVTEEATEALNDRSRAYTADYDAIEASMARARGEAEDFASGEDEASSSATDVAASAKTITFADAIAGALALASALGQAEANASAISVGPIGGVGGRAIGTKNAPGGPTLVNELGPELISENGKAYIANGGKPGIVNLSKGAIVLTAKETKDALRGNGSLKTINAAAIGIKAVAGDWNTDPSNYPNPSAGGGSEGGTEGAVTGLVIGADSDFTDQTPTGSPKKRNGSRKKEKLSAKRKARRNAKKLADRLTNIDKNADLAHTEERYADESALYSEAIELIQEQLELYRKAKYKETSNEVVDLKKKLHDYEDKLAAVEKTQWDAEIDAREKALREQREKDQMAEKEAAVEKARQALENAKSQRNVRIFNAATGQWEWVADQGAIQRAQEQFDSAQKAYTQAMEDAEINELKRRRDAGELYPEDDGEISPEIADLIGSALSKRSSSGIGSGQSSEAANLVFGGAPRDTSFMGVSSGVAGDSHDTIYNFGNITLSEAEAESTTVAELAKRLNVLKIS